MTIVKNMGGLTYQVGHYTPEGVFEPLVCDIDGALVAFFDFDEAVSIAGRINGSGAAAAVVPSE